MFKYRDSRTIVRSYDQDRDFDNLPIDKDFVSDERVVWIDIVGVPLCAWTSNAFKKISTLWGERLFVDLDKEESLTHGKVCVLTKLMSKIQEGIRVKVNEKYYDVLINEFAYWAPDFDLDGDCESNESFDSDCLDRQKSNTSADPKVFQEYCTQQPMPKSVLEQSESDPFNLIGLIGNQCTNSVKKDKVNVINYDMDKVMEEAIPTENKATEFNKYQANHCQEGSCNEQRIDNTNLGNENIHTNIISSSALLNFKNKLQGLKGAIKGWVNARRNRFKFVSQHQLEILESEVSMEEIKDVVWDYGSDESPGPYFLFYQEHIQEEWIKCREDFNKLWADIYAKNHYKSLDHRSFYFKQQDLKYLSTKCLVAEIKEIKEKSQKDDDVLYTVAAGKQVNQVLKLWTTFLEPMLYVPSRAENSDNVKDVEISTRGVTRNKGKSDGSPGADSVTFDNVKQGKPACNGDDNVSPKRVDSSKVIMVNGGTLPKEDGSRVEKDVKNTSIRDKAPAVGVVNDNVLPISSTELSGRDATPRPRNVHDDGHEAKLNIDDVPSSQQGDTSRTPPVANGNFAKFKKEEGELSPNVYFDEADLAAYGDHNGLNAKAKHSMEIDADVDDEDSKNVSEGGDDVSGSKSTTDGCSREDHEDGDRDDLEGKTESEGEVEGIEDADFISADGTYSDHILLSAKPLEKRVASPLHDGGKKDCNVFYGNESFYALFWLHQVKAWLESEKDIRPPYIDFSLMDILPGKSTSYILDSWYSLGSYCQSGDFWRWYCDTMDSFSVNELRKHLDCLPLPSHYLATRWDKIVPRGLEIGCLIARPKSPFHLPPIEFLDFVNRQGNFHKAKECNLPGSGFTFFLAVTTFITGSGNALCILFPTILP
nr:paired amphipathic helix protein Sin3-like 2 isoform X3 [Tanacetum cinerariifolium]